MDVIANSDIAIVGGSSFAYMATLFGYCVTIAPSGVSFETYVKEEIEGDENEYEKRLVEYPRYAWCLTGWKSGPGRAGPGGVGSGQVGLGEGSL